MSDLLDKAVLIGMGLEKRAKEALEELERSGKAATEKRAAADGVAPALSSKQVIENKVVEDAVKVLKDLLGAITTGKDKFEKEAQTAAERVMEKLNVPTRTEVDVIKEMTRISREKVDLLERRIEELERRLTGGHL